MADCNKTVDFFKEFNRMCDTFDCDDNCPFLCFNSSRYVSCEDFVKKFNDEAVQILQKWSDCNPEPKPKTYADDFFEKFPNAARKTGNIPFGCRGNVYGFDCKYYDHEQKFDPLYCVKCWNEPYEGER